jgi:hypothetical protein
LNQSGLSRSVAPAAKPPTLITPPRAPVTYTGIADADGDIAFDEEPCAEPASTAGVIRFAEP